MYTSPVEPLVVATFAKRPPRLLEWYSYYRCTSAKSIARDATVMVCTGKGAYWLIISHSLVLFVNFYPLFTRFPANVIYPGCSAEGEEGKMK
jgi:hypothetical protein